MQCFHQLVSTLFTELRALSSLLLSHNSDRLVKLQDQGYACRCLLSTEITSVLCHALHFMWSWVLNSSSHACMASIVLTGPSPQPIAHSLLGNRSLYYSVLEWLWPRTSGIQSLVKNFPKACIGDMHKHELEYTCTCVFWLDSTKAPNLPQREYFLLHV